MDLSLRLNSFLIWQEMGNVLPSSCSSSASEHRSITTMTACSHSQAQIVTFRGNKGNRQINKAMETFHHSMVRIPASSWMTDGVKHMRFFREKKNKEPQDGTRCSRYNVMEYYFITSKDKHTKDFWLYLLELKRPLWTHCRVCCTFWKIVWFY